MDDLSFLLENGMSFREIQRLQEQGIPTAEIAGADLVSLPTGERNVLTMLAARLLCAVGEPHTYAETAVTLECGGGSFTAKGRTEAAMGWKEAERACLAR